MSGQSIYVNKITKYFGKFKAVSDANLEVKAGEIVCLLGPSGCGKTTLMRIIAGLESPSKGSVFLGDKNVTKLSTEVRNIGLVFQNPVVYPHLTVFDNVMIGLKSRSFSTKRINSTLQSKVDYAIRLTGLDDYIQTNVDLLNATLQQRVSVAREITRDNEILIFDEPLTNVDANERAQFEQSIKKVVRDSGRAAIYVTHDQIEAMSLGDRIALMKDGEIVQDAEPDEIYSNPINQFVGWFIGSPGMNICHLEYDNESSHLLSFLSDNINVPKGTNSIGFRAENVLVSSSEKKGYVPYNIIRSTVSVAGRRLLKLSHNDTIILAKCDDSIANMLNDKAWIKVPEKHIRFFN